MPAQLSLRALHVRFDGRSFDLPLNDLTLNASEDDVKRVVAQRLEVAHDRLRDYVVDWHESGNLTVRPPAVFG